MSKHTPGPWRAEASGKYSIGIARVLSGNGNGDTTDTIVADVYNGVVETADANARLIAKAPEMLEFIRTVDLAMTGGPNKADVIDLRNKARAILKDLEG